MQATKAVVTDWDWTKVVARLGPSDFAYIDPPYRGCDTRSYRDDIDHERLVWVLKHAKFRWILSHYIHPIYLSTLGQPFWAKDMSLLCLSRDKEIRTECLWRSFPGSQHDTKCHILPKSAIGRMRELDNAASLSFSALDAKIDTGLEKVTKDWNALVPYLLEMNRRLSAPGRRSDLRNGAPSDLTWTAWVQSKRKKLGRSLRSVQRLLSGKSEASKNRQSQPCATVARGSVNAPKMPTTPMEIAAEMARLVVQMPDQGEKSGSDWKRLTGLAKQFLKIAAQASTPQEATGRLARVRERQRRIGLEDAGLRRAKATAHEWKLQSKGVQPSPSSIARR